MTTLLPAQSFYLCHLITARGCQGSQAETIFLSPTPQDAIALEKIYPRLKPTRAPSLSCPHWDSSWATRGEYLRALSTHKEDQSLHDAHYQRAAAQARAEDLTSTGCLQIAPLGWQPDTETYAHSSLQAATYVEQLSCGCGCNWPSSSPEGSTPPPLFLHELPDPTQTPPLFYLSTSPISLSQAQVSELFATTSATHHADQVAHEARRADQRAYEDLVAQEAEMTYDQYQAFRMAYPRPPRYSSTPSTYQNTLIQALCRLGLYPITLLNPLSPTHSPTHSPSTTSLNHPGASMTTIDIPAMPTTLSTTSIPAPSRPLQPSDFGLPVVPALTGLPTPLTTRTVALLLSCSSRKVRTWAKKGYLTATFIEERHYTSSSLQKALPYAHSRRDMFLARRLGVSLTPELSQSLTDLDALQAPSLSIALARHLLAASSAHGLAEVSLQGDVLTLIWPHQSVEIRPEGIILTRGEVLQALPLPWSSAPFSTLSRLTALVLTSENPA